MQIKKTLTSGKNKKNACSCLGSRYYNPRESVWLSVDPLVEKTMQPYQYCYQNPVNLIDPTGMKGDDIYEIDKKGNLTRIAESDRDVIYTSDNFEDKDGKRVLKDDAKDGYDIGRRDFIKDNKFSTGNGEYIKFGTDQAKGMEYFNQVADWSKEGKVNSEFIIQTAYADRWLNIGGNTTQTLVGTSGNESNVAPYFKVKEVLLNGHTHIGTFNMSKMASGQLNPSGGFFMKQFPTKDNGYTFIIEWVSNRKTGDRYNASLMGEKTVNFIYAPSYDTTEIYNSETIIKAYGGKYDPSK